MPLNYHWKTEKARTANKRFHASGGVCPQTVLWEFGSAPPAQTFVIPPAFVKPCEPLCAILRTTPQTLTNRQNNEVRSELNT
jgi:hypothetical protein